VKNEPGVEIESIAEGSIADQAGLRSMDRLVKVNGNKIRDVIDLMFYSNETDLDFTVSRRGAKLSVAVSRSAVLDRRSPRKRGEASGMGISLKPFHTRSCMNNCIFCFVSQLPKGLRKSLYLKDDDYRMSFLYGNYVTLTNLSSQDMERIIAQHLSPLYISVHSTNTGTRNKLLGVQTKVSILKEIKLLADNNIRMHTQIVLCPGYNDGKDLEQTIADLCRFYPYVQSIAVVPVGLTAHRKKQLKPVGREDALKALATIGKFQTRLKRKYGENIVYAADELYIKGEMPFPPLEGYGELPQIENGVGMVPLFLHQARKIRIPNVPQKSSGDKRFITFTGTSFYTYLSGYTGRLRKAGIEIEAIPVENTFFGPSVTVTGLLTGRDVIKSLSGLVDESVKILVPDVVLRSEGDMFLDDITLQDLEEVLGAPAAAIESTPQGLLKAVTRDSGLGTG
jgi:putative radical SAM enzyme (TIGR03279 family)